MRHRKLPLDVCPQQTLVAVLIDLITEFLMSHMSKTLVAVLIDLITEFLMSHMSKVSVSLQSSSVPHESYEQGKCIITEFLMRHRKLPLDVCPQQTLVAVLIDLITEFLMSHMSKTLVAVLIDLITEFLMSHMSKVFPIELYTLAVGIIHRILCYQKSYRVINIFNLFITYGDTFLPSPSCYDELYYEIIRVHVIFDTLYSMAFKHSTIDSSFKHSALLLTNSLINVRAIINHLAPKIDAWLAKQALSTPSEDQILEIVRANYDSLTLKLQDNLDQFERYSENPKHISFFTYMVRNVVTDARSNIEYHSLDLQQILHDFSSIT
ncbi:hypothetical protein M8J76_009879 [Diaphorina citri]|nr:hypothetical protein M8J76_009879 [Diaphorina citri]